MTRHQRPRTRPLRVTAAFGGALALLLSAAPADAQTPAPPQAQPIALTGGTIHTVSGETIENGTLVFDGGVITAVGRTVQVPAGARQIDVSGRHLYPGLIDADSDMGLYEIGAVDVTVDLNELGGINPNARAHVAFNPESRHIGTARSQGVLVAVSTPSGGLISGLSAAMMLDGWTWEEMALKPEAGLIVNWPSPVGSPWGGGGNVEERYNRGVAELREAFANARAYRQAVRAAEAGNASVPASDPRLEALIPVLDGYVPVVVSANELRQIQDALTWAQEEEVRLVIRGGRDAHYVADRLARTGTPVLITSVLTSPSRAWEAYDSEYSLPAQLYRAGVRFAIAGPSSAPYATRLPYEAGAAIAFGLPEREAIRAVTLYPAQHLGISDRVGSLEVGKDATLLITSGSPLEYGTTIEQAFIQGREIDMIDAHRHFFEKYRQRLR
jgi:imidazolonepropionase-like amidohydrolase